MRRLLRQMRADLFDNAVEGLGVADGQFAEHLAVERDAGGDGGGDEAVVGDAALAEGGVEAADPEGAEVALLLAAVAVGVFAGLEGELEGDAVDCSWAAGETSGFFENAFAFAAVDDAAFGTWHVAGPFGVTKRARGTD